MECAPQCCFGSNGGSSDVRWTSETFYAGAQRAASAVEAIQTVNMWKSDAMAILSGVSHGASTPMRQFDDYAYITLSSNPNALAELEAREVRHFGEPIASGTTQAYGYSFFVGIPGGGHILKKKEYHVLGSTPLNLLQSSSGICTLGSLSGVRADGYPRLYRQNGLWRADWIGPTRGEFYPMCYYFAQDQ
jgi:hypothetical protein